MSDASSTSPRPRHAARTDEGGRGPLIARLADAWGARCTPTGTAIWTRQAVRAAAT